MSTLRSTLILLVALVGTASARCNANYQCLAKGKCIRHWQTPTDFDGNKRLCDADGTNMMSIISAAEGNELIDLYDRYTDHFWTGAMCNETTGSYEFTDGRNAAYLNSYPGVRSNPCYPDIGYHYHAAYGHFEGYGNFMGATNSSYSAANSVCFHSDPDCVPVLPTVEPTVYYTDDPPMNPYLASACGKCNISDVWLDIIFAVDSSESMTKTGVFAVQATVRTIMLKLQLDRPIVRAGVVSFSDKAKVAYTLKDINSDENVYDMVIPYLGGYGTNMEAAIVTSMALFNDYPSSNNARQVIVFFSSTYREGPYKSPIALSTAFQNESGVIMTVDYTPINKPGNNPMLHNIASPGYEFIRNDDIAEQMGDGFCDANCFCPMRTAGYTKGMGNGCSGDRCTPTGGCYSAVTIPSEWKAAEMDCIDNDGNLASIHEADQQRFLTNQFAPRTKFWIGFNTFNYTWTDSYFYDYNNWYSGQPSSAGFCTYSQQYSGLNTAWYTENCRNDLQYACSVKPCSARNRNCRPVGVRKQRKLH